MSAESKWIGDLGVVMPDVDHERWWAFCYASKRCGWLSSHEVSSQAIIALQEHLSSRHVVSSVSETPQP